MTLAAHADVVSPSLVVGTCATGPLGILLIVAIVILLRLHADSDKRRRWKRIVAFLVGLVVLSVVFALWSDQQWHDQRERRYQERERAREEAAPPDAALESSANP
jgi:hypothetical protein